VLAALTCGVTWALQELGVTSFTAAELARHLGADKLTTGAYIFQHPPVIPAAG
jgi:hypothetical protein